jgi:hypothetical protein
MMAVKGGASTEVVRLLLDNKADATAADGVTRFCIALAHSFEAGAEYRVESFAAVSVSRSPTYNEIQSLHDFRAAGWKYCIDVRRDKGCEGGYHAASARQRCRDQHQRQKRGNSLVF